MEMYESSGGNDSNQSTNDKRGIMKTRETNELLSQVHEKDTSFKIKCGRETAKL